MRYGGRKRFGIRRSRRIRRAGFARRRTALRRRARRATGVPRSVRLYRPRLMPCVSEIIFPESIPGVWATVGAGDIEDEPIGFDGVLNAFKSFYLTTRGDVNGARSAGSLHSNGCRSRWLSVRYSIRPHQDWLYGNGQGVKGALAYRVIIFRANDSYTTYGDIAPTPTAILDTNLATPTFDEPLRAAKSNLYPTRYSFLYDKVHHIGAEKGFRIDRKVFLRTGTTLHGNEGSAATPAGKLGFGKGGIMMMVMMVCDSDGADLPITSSRISYIDIQSRHAYYANLPPRATSW